MIPKNILSKIHYQSFEELGKKGSSDSNGKFKCIEEFFKDHTGKVLDVGCNNGYFCFNLYKTNSQLSCHGIDQGKENIEIAKMLNEQIFKQSATTFTHINFFNLSPKTRYDHIICLSAFHYFREHQQQFLSTCYNMLPPTGTLSLELPLANKNVSGYVEKFSRAVDSTPCYFPSQLTFEKWLSDSKFNIYKKTLSVVQPGTDRNPRYCYLLKKSIL